MATTLPCDHFMTVSTKNIFRLCAACVNFCLSGQELFMGQKCELTTLVTYPYCCCLVAQSCSALWDPMYCSLPGSSAHGISQARIPEWVAISFSRGSFWPRDWTHISYIGRLVHYHWATREAPHPNPYIYTEIIRLLTQELLLTRMSFNTAFYIFIACVPPSWTCF